MLTAGVDEVGRGSLAGPVVACAVILPLGYENPNIKDSKKLTAKKREHLNKLIREKAISVGIGVVSNEVIDSIGIVPATKQAMHEAIAQLNVVPTNIIIDAVELDNLPCPYIHPFKAEDKYICVAAASIVAKVYRDSLMARLAAIYPHYGWERNSGYGTKLHYQGITDYGLTPLHRRSFLKGFH
ncbi:hypothetical protein RsTz2092_10450 [Deferribacterales bacterium RsTz2092]|nr:hypothetical protein AGMMS49941_08860 [Deferribacterales bacterium]